MGNLVSSYPRPTRRRRRLHEQHQQQRRRQQRQGGAAGTTTHHHPLPPAPPAQLLLAALADAADGEGPFPAFTRALASLPPSAAALVCRQDPRVLHAAAASGDLRVLRAALDRGANPALPSPALGAAPLHAAATPQAAHLLIASGANAFLADARGRTPADLAGKGMVAPGGGGGSGASAAAAAAAAALVRAIESGAPFAGRVAIAANSSSSSSSAAAYSSSAYSPPYSRRNSSSRNHHSQQQQQNWAEAWVVVSPVYESRPFGASPPRAALAGELRAYSIPQFAASNADTLPLAAPAPFLRVPLDGCRVEREAEDAGIGGSAGRCSAGVRLLVLPGDPRCLLPRRWRAEDEERGTGLGSGGSNGGSAGGAGHGGDLFVLRLRPSVAGDQQGLLPSSQAFSRLVALCRDSGLRESAAAAAAAGGLAAASAAVADADDLNASPSSPTAAAAAPTIPLPPPDVMAAAEAREVEAEAEEAAGEASGSGAANANGHANANQKQQQQGRCVVCWAAPASMGLVHGGTVHVCACARCARRLATSLCPSCPVCRQPVREVLAVFRSDV